MKEFYRRRLPHWQPHGAIIFLTYRLYGSLPREAFEKLAEEKRRLEKEPPRPNESRRERTLRESMGMFALADDALDSARKQPQWLARDDIAEIVLENLFFRAEKSYRLWAFAIMPNHVHTLVEPLGNAPNADSEEKDFIALAQITHALKSFTAHRANEILKRTGTFWERESYDHWVRDAKEFARVVEYIENNPVKAGLVDSPEQWRWSSAAFERGEDGTCVNQRAK